MLQRIALIYNGGLAILLLMDWLFLLIAVLKLCQSLLLYAVVSFNGVGLRSLTLEHKGQHL